MPVNPYFPSSTSRVPNSDAALESLMRCITMNETTIEMGNDVYESLQGQGKQIERVSDLLTKIDDSVDDSERTIGKIKSYFGFGVWNKITRIFRKKNQVKNAIEAGERKISNQKFSIFKKKNTKTIHQATSDPIESALSIVNSQVKQITDISLKVKAELEVQNCRLETTNTAADIAVNNLQKITTNTENAI